MSLIGKKILLVLVFIAGLAFIFVYFTKTSPSNFFTFHKGKTYSINLTEEGFEPKKIVIHQGDIIVFRTTRNKLFWPASNLHPTHLLYPEFDPKRPVDPRNSWSFTFEKIGTWPFHDHLFPYYRGEIKVIATGEKSS